MKKSRRLLTLFAVLFMVIFALSCVFISACGNKDDGDDGNTDVPETTEPEGGTDDGSGDDGGNVETEDVYKVAVTAEGDATAVAVGGTLQLTASVTCNGTAVEGASVTWVSGDTSAATVSEAGLVTGVSTSESVTITAAYGTATGTISIAVKEHTHSYSVEEWKWAPDYSTCTLTLKCANTDGLCYAPEVTENATVTSNNSATCDAAGQMTYTAKYDGSYGTFTDTQTGSATQATGNHTYSAEPTYNETSGSWGLTCSVCGQTKPLTDGTGYTFNVSTESQLSSAAALDGAEIVLSQDITLTGGLSVVSGVEVTLNLAGRSLTYTGPSSYDGTGSTYATVYAVVVGKNASLTVKDSSNATETSQMGSIDLNYNIPEGYSDMKYSRRFAAIETEGTLKIEGGYIKSSSVGIVAEGEETYEEDGATVTGGYTYISGGYIDAEQYSIFEGAGTNVVVYITGGTVSGGRGICVDGDAYFGYDTATAGADGTLTATHNWQDSAKTTLCVYGGTIISAGRSAISTLGYADASSTYVYIHGGSIMGADLSTLGEDETLLADNTDFATVYIANGTLVVTDGEIKGTYALSVKGGTTNISGGTFTSTGAGSYDFAANSSKPQPYALSVVYYGPQPQGSVTGRDSVENDLSVTVSGGTFDGDIVFDDTEATGEETASLTITGGIFTCCPANYIGDECSMYDYGDVNGDGICYVVVPYVLMQSDAESYTLGDSTASYAFAATEVTVEMQVDENGNVTYVFTGEAGRMADLQKEVYEKLGWTIAREKEGTSQDIGYVVFQIYVEKGWKITTGTEQKTLIDNENGTQDTYLYVVFGFAGEISEDDPITVTYTVSYETESGETESFDINIKLTNVTIAADDAPPAPGGESGSGGTTPGTPGGEDDEDENGNGDSGNDGNGQGDDSSNSPPPAPGDDDGDDDE